MRSGVAAAAGAAAPPTSTPRQRRGAKPPRAAMQGLLELLRARHLAHPRMVWSRCGFCARRGLCDCGRRSRSSDGLRRCLRWRGSRNGLRCCLWGRWRRLDGWRFRLPHRRRSTRRETRRLRRCTARILLGLRLNLARHACTRLRTRDVGRDSWHRLRRLYCSRRNAIELRWLCQRRRIVAGQRGLCDHTAIRNGLRRHRWRDARYRRYLGCRRSRH